MKLARIVGWVTVALAMVTGATLRAADFALPMLQGEWTVTDFSTGTVICAVKVKDQQITALVKGKDGLPFYGADGSGKIEPLAGNRFVVVVSDLNFGKAEAGYVFRGDVVSDGLLLRSGRAAWSVARATPESLKKLASPEKYGIESDASMRPVPDRTRPQPRDSLVKTQTVRPTILDERLAGTSNIGPTADPKWKNHGAYLQRMIDTVQVQWERLLTESKVYPTSGSTVAVKFIMDSKGAITKVVDVKSTASDAASRACMSAITDRSPYGDWTEDMIAVLGTQQEMTFTFYYQ